MLLLAISWALYFFIHSALASLWVKEKVRSYLPSISSYYRIIYNMIAILGLLPLLAWSISKPINMEIPFHQILGGLISLIGLYFMRKAFQSFDMAEFLGLKSDGDALLVTKGMYGYVRHPLYFASILLIGGLFLLFPSHTMLMVMLVSYVYIIIGSKLEERKLRKQFGQPYKDYAKQVKALIPYVY